MAYWPPNVKMKICQGVKPPGPLVVTAYLFTLLQATTCTRLTLIQKCCYRRHPHIHTINEGWYVELKYVDNYCWIFETIPKQKCTSYQANLDGRMLDYHDYRGCNVTTQRFDLISDMFVLFMFFPILDICSTIQHSVINHSLSCLSLCVRSFIHSLLFHSSVVTLDALCLKCHKSALFA